MPKLSGIQATVLQVTNDQATIDLPASNGTPVSIDTTGDLIVQLVAYITADFFATLAANDTEAATRLADDATRNKWPAGFYNFDVAGLSDKKLYFKSQAGSATTDGISYQLVGVA